MAAEASPGRIRQRSTGAQLIWPDTSRKISSLSGLAKRCEIEIAYAIGVARPVSVLVRTEGTGKLPDEKITEIISREFDLRPAKIISHLGLRNPIYRQHRRIRPFRKARPGFAMGEA